MRFIEQKYLQMFSESVGKHLPDWFAAFDFSSQQIDLGYRIQASAVYSSNIEGNTIDINSYMNSIIAKENFKPRKELQEIEDLVKAYEFAKENELTEKNLLKAHKILSQTILIKDKRGKYRTDRMGVFDNTGLVYLAIESENVASTMKELFKDIQDLLQQNLSLTAIFYHTSLIHLKLAHIHPFWDGNGRAARLLEKWFLSTKINSRAWYLQSEKYYKEHLSAYYQNINLGVNYYELDYDKCLPFLEMLPQALKE